jgi:hypothetical protein
MACCTTACARKKCRTLTCQSTPTHKTP